MASNILQQTVKTPKQLYKFLLRSCDHLPKGAKEYYKHTVKQSFKQHIFEPDPDRVKQIIEKSLSDATWIFKKDLSTIKTNATTEKFLRAITIWLNGPHLVNKNILSSEIILTAELSNYEIDSLIVQLANIENMSGIITEDLNKNIELFDNWELTLLPKNTDFIVENQNNKINSNVLYLVVSKLYPKDIKNFSSTIHFTVIDGQTNNIICLSKSFDDNKRSLSMQWPYKISYNNEEIKISVAANTENLNHPSVCWIKNKLLPSLRKWILSNVEHNKSLVKGSLNLISIEKYCDLYIKLKNKYGTYLINNWTESTDPQKFVFEDIAIATYLLILWEQERQEEHIKNKQAFLDLGCGNGLLAYILTNEGHTGLGIDLRKRKIWDFFSHSTQLEERTIIPSSKSLFPDSDWIIGNHSDELTPWIPVIAARSSYKCKFFLLPCCAYEFDGRKYQRTSAANSQYSEYLEYVKSICEGCGFITKIDKLRIPSTKRICLIGLKRNYEEIDTDTINSQIERIIIARSANIEQREEIATTMEEKWSQNFKPRDLVEKVKNCTKIDKNIVNEIVDLVASYLLSKVRPVNIGNDNSTWNAGGKIKLCEIAKIIPSATLLQLKNECGGLQTLLKNNSHIFQVIDSAVQFRIPGSYGSVIKKRRNKSNIQLRVKPCWFFFNHPNGCPLNSEKCNFKH